jgi:translocation and assembly module TamA
MAWFGYGTDTGFRGKFTWDNRLVNSRGHRWRVETTLSQAVQEAVARYVIPVGDPSLEKLEFSTGYVNEDLGDLESERIELAGGLTQVFGSWQRVLFLKLNHETTTFPDGTETQDLLLIPGISYASLPPNFLTGWVRNAAYHRAFREPRSRWAPDASYLRFYSRAERVWPISGPWHVRLRGEFGTSWVNEFSKLPASQRFFAGGDRSVRGFALDELSRIPKSADGSDTGEHRRRAQDRRQHRTRARLFATTARARSSSTRAMPSQTGARRSNIRSASAFWKLPMMLIGLDVAGTVRA